LQTSLIKSKPQTEKKLLTPRRSNSTSHLIPNEIKAPQKETIEENKNNNNDDYHKQRETSMRKKFSRIDLMTPVIFKNAEAKRLMEDQVNKKSIGLTPIQEDLAELLITSNKKKPKDDFALQLRSKEKLQLAPSFQIED
jgi:hypothetical protein